MIELCIHPLTSSHICVKKRRCICNIHMQKTTLDLDGFRIHLLHDSRGPVLESIVARTIRQIETTQARRSHGYH